MGTIEMNSKVMELKELEAFRDEISAEIEAIRDSLKAEMKRRGKEELSVGVFKLRYKMVQQKKFDSRRFQKDHGDLYESYRIPSDYMRFTCQ